MTTISADLLEILRCPATRQRLMVADAGQLERLNAVAGVVERLDAALVREDGRAAYPVSGGIPVLLADACIALA